MRRQLLLVLPLLPMGAVTLFAGDVIPVIENGKRVFRNDVAASSSARAAAAVPESKASSSSRVLIYWSQSEHRWKAVSPPSPNTMNRAQSAVDDVRRILASKNSSTNYRLERVDLPVHQPANGSIAPDTSSLAHNGAVSQESIDKAIAEASSRHDVDVNLVRALIKVESNFNPKAVSRKGAMGLMQLMPETAKTLKVTNAFDPKQNVDAGVRHLKQLLRDYNGDVALSLAAYNAGSGAVNRSKGIPPISETRDYVKKITHLYVNAPPPKPASGIVVTRDSAGHFLFTNQ